MTRASLLHILNHVGSISETEIRELEQLAAAFPYCQTAHVLLAKAAHDQGSMLASQRLRRAATYAADRQLLRQLLEEITPETTTVELSTPKELPAPTEASLLGSAAGTGNSTAFFQSLVTEDVQPMESPEEVTTAAEEMAPDTPEVSVSERLASLDSVVAALETDALETVAPEQPTLIEPASAETQLEDPDSLETIEPTGPAEASEEAPEISEDSADNVPALLTYPEADTTDSEPTEPSLPTAEVETDNAPVEADAAPISSVVAGSELEEALPAVAPIQPPAEAGISRFEFGLSELNKLPVPILYQLPGLEEEEAVEEADESYNLLSPAATTVLAPPFRADPDLAYSMLEDGSRFGYALQLRDDELTLPLPATEFFPPDALLHAHAASTNQPRFIPAPSSLELINRFLKVQPRLKAPGVLPSVNEQTDLAARSTHAPPALASESLAKILIKQGKTERAVEIYEQLMVRQPEKSAYFADQIQQLKPSE